ncbi:MAG: tetratricopeptide repeat protein [Terriglobales bacterium]|jgi:tetratricopeptide (TPR) repeat protein
MITHACRVLLVLMMLVAASVADSAREMLSAGRVDDAIAELNGRLSSVPADAESANLLCRAYFEVEDWERAESSCKKATVLNPNDGRFHLWLGRVYGERANRTNFLVATSLAAKVRVEFERAVQLNPDDVDARLDLARFYIEAPSIMGGGEEKAREQAQAVATVNPGREHWIYARIAEQKKDYASAEREYHQYIDLSHGDADAWLNLALFLRRQSRLDEMEQAVVKLSQSPMPKLDVLVEAAETLYRAGRSYPFATELLHRYLASGPVEAAPAFKARYLRGLLLEKQGDKAGAAQEYRASLALVRNFGTAQQALDRVAH